MLINHLLKPLVHSGIKNNTNIKINWLDSSNIINLKKNIKN